MSRVITFVSNAHLSAKENLSEFVGYAKTQLSLWREEPGFDWSQCFWKVDGFGFRFIRYEDRGLHKDTALISANIFSDPFMDFAKAYVRYVLTESPRKQKKKMIVALRLLEKALRDLDGHSEVWRAEIRHFFAAEDLLVKDDYGDASGVGSALVEIAKFLSMHHLTASNLSDWKHRFRGNNMRAQPNRKYKNGQPKLPNDDALFAIAEVFANGYNMEQDDEDVFVTCLTTMMASTPMRISELLAAPLNDFLRYDLDSQGVKQLYLPWKSPKNMILSNKPIPKTMASLVEDAYKRIATITEPARLLAKHYETNPNEFYAHELLPDVPPDKELTVVEVVAALGLTNRKGAESFLYNAAKIRRLKGWTLKSLWEVVLKRHHELNPHFPYQVDPRSNVDPVKMADSLMCFTHQQISRDNRSSVLLLAPVNRDFYQKRISGTEPSMCFFLKHSFPGYDIRSHQLRHLLNTLYQKSGLSIELITKFSSRASQSQTRVYMHQTSEERTAQIIASRGLMKDETQQPIDAEQYLTIPKGPTLVSQYGVCNHNYAFSPCEKFHDCLSCSELVVCKGHKRSITAIKQERERVYENWLAAKTKIDAGFKVATPWFRAHTARLKKLDSLIQMLENPALADGAFVQMTGADFSHSRRIVTSKMREAQVKPPVVVTHKMLSGEVLECLKLFMSESDE